MIDYGVISKPDSVIIRGSKMLLDSIYFVETETYYEEDVFKSISKKVNLKPIQGVNFSKGKVDIELSVSRYSEKELNIPIELINQPKGIKVKLFPANSKIRTTIPMKIIGNVGISDFRLIADYNKILDGQTQKIRIICSKETCWRKTNNFRTKRSKLSNKKMIIIGLTGGIGSGKSTILNYFREHGYPCFESDEVGKKLLEVELKETVLKLFGEEVYNAKGILDRKAISKKVFSNSKLLETLNDIVHPAVNETFEKFKKKHQDFPVIVKEAAILIESGSYKSCDIIVLVKAPLDERIKRIVTRDSVNESEVIARIDNQWEDEKLV